MKNVNENSDIVNWFFIKKFQLLVENVFPILKITDYIARKEFQGRGAIHIHAIVAADGDVTPKDLELAIKSTQYPDEPVNLQVNEVDDDIELQSFQAKLDEHNSIILSRNKVADFAVNQIGLTALHPNPDPRQWVEAQPHLKDPESLKLNFKDIYNSGNAQSIYEKRVNIFQRHKCTHGYCLRYNKGNKGSNEAMCRFKYPRDFHGFLKTIDSQNRLCSIHRMQVNPDKYKDDKTKHKEEELVAPNGASFVDGKLCLICNHATFVQHIKEMALVWGANTEAQLVLSWLKSLMYILKYVLKPEKPSEVFNRIAREILNKEGLEIPARKVFSRLLINSIDRDKSRAECFLIALGYEYVEYSQRFVWVSLNGSKHLKKIFLLKMM